MATTVKVLLVLGGALAAGVARYLPLATTPFNYQALIGAVGAIAAFVGGCLLLLLDKSLSGDLVDAAEAVSELEKVRADAALLGRLIDRAEDRSRRAGALRASAMTLRQAIERTLSRPPNMSTAITDLLDVALSDLQKAISLGATEHWTISVYQADGTPILLRRVATRRSDRFEESQPSREWSPGEGHIGTTYTNHRKV